MNIVVWQTSGQTLNFRVQMRWKTRDKLPLFIVNSQVHLQHRPRSKGEIKWGNVNESSEKMKHRAWATPDTHPLKEGFLRSKCHDLKVPSQTDDGNELSRIRYWLLDTITITSLNFFPVGKSLSFLNSHNAGIATGNTGRRLGGSPVHRISRQTLLSTSSRRAFTTNNLTTFDEHIT